MSLQETQPIQPVMAPLPKPNTSIWKIVVLVIGYILSVLVGIGIVGGMGIGCAFGNSGFMCQRLLPFSTGVGIVLSVLLLMHIYKPLRGIAKKSYWIILLVWILLIGLIAVLPDKARFTYIYGMTKESCVSGKPTVPWGYVYSGTNSCLMALGDCFALDTYNKYCFQKEQQTAEQVVDVKQCDSFKFGVNECKLDLAIRTSNMDYCRTLEKDDASVADEEYAWEQYSCVQSVVFSDVALGSLIEASIQEKMNGDPASTTGMLAKYAKYGKEFCAGQEGVNKQDACLFRVIVENQGKSNICSEIRTDWLKSACMVYVSDK